MIDKAPKYVEDLVAAVMAESHPLLVEAGVTVACQFHTSKRGLRLRGVPAAAVVELVPAKNRLDGMADARITFDSIEWSGLREDIRRSIVDHELTHLVPVVKARTEEVSVPGEPGKYTKVKRYDVATDDAGRPKLKIRAHDWELGGFKEVIERHGEAAYDRRAFRSVVERFKQVLMPWG